MKKSLWKYMCECNWTFPIAGSIFALTCAYFSGRWVEGLVGLAGVWLFSLIMIYSLARREMRKDIERENREPVSCPKCGHQTKSDYCENCGNRLDELHHPKPAKTKCYHCGRPCTSKYCGHCGCPQ